MAITRSDEDQWNEYRSILGRHVLAGHDVVDTINRLLEKSPWLKEAGANLQIPKDDLVILEETWELSRLWPLIHSRQVTSQEPTLRNGAVLLLRWADVEYLIDGRRRINSWHRNGVVGPHRTLVVQSSRLG